MSKFVKTLHLSPFPPYVFLLNAGFILALIPLKIRSLQGNKRNTADLLDLYILQQRSVSK